ncbi:MAG: sugar kinase [Terriglobia bacterium]
MDVICVGILVADIFASPVDAIPDAGQVKITDRFLLGIGGCAANTAVDLCRLGKSAKVLGKVGTDLFGDFIANDLRRSGVDSGSLSRSTQHPTSGTFILNVQGQDRRYIHFFGANADFSFADIDCSALDGARVVYLGGYLLMPHFGIEDLIRLFQEAKKRSMMTVLDVVVPAEVSVSRDDLKKMLQYTDVFLPNDDEAFALTGHRSALEQSAFFAGLNPECTTVITLGSRGALVRQRDKVLCSGVYSMKSIDGSGAGDAFDAGFITGLLEGWPVEKTLQFASAVGASCTRALGCTAGVFRFDEAIRFMQENPLKIEVLRA